MKLLNAMYARGLADKVVRQRNTKEWADEITSGIADAIGEAASAGSYEVAFKMESNQSLVDVLAIMTFNLRNSGYGVAVALCDQKMQSIDLLITW